MERRRHERTLDEEGIPDLDGPLPKKVATGDPQEGAAPPSNRPASLDYGVTAAEQRAGEPIGVRVDREVPDTSEPGDEQGPDLDDGSATGADDVEPDVGFSVVTPEDENLGVEDVEPDEVARQVHPGLGALSPEEAALHTEAEP